MVGDPLTQEEIDAAERIAWRFDMCYLCADGLRKLALMFREVRHQADLEVEALRHADVLKCRGWLVG